MPSQPLSFYFSTRDPAFSTTTVVVKDAPDYISHTFVKTPIYSFNDKPIGYKVSDDYVQQVAPGKYIVRLNNTYHVDGRGSISWQYTFMHDNPTVYYPVNVAANSNILNTTGEFYGQSGTVTLFPKEDGSRLVTVSFDNV